MRAIILAAMIVTTPAEAWAEPANAAAAVAATSSRSEANIKLDGSRKPVELLSFLGLEKGMSVVDMFGANQYWAEIIGPAVGPGGHVVVWQPNQFLNDRRRATFAEFAARQGNALLINSPFELPVIGTNAYDLLLMNLDYHDVYWVSAERNISRMDPDMWLKSLFDAMKPGGILGIIDHASAPGGDPRIVVEKLHRIDPAVVKADFERAGFVFEGESDMLRNSADNHSLNVFDASIRGKTDRFVFKFRKPQ
jgi:predicted methyltransferase